jgi:PAS domain-containing protein
MKSSRAQFFLASMACGALTVALAISLGGYFRSVEAGGDSNLTEKRLLAHLQAYHDRLKGADTPEEARSAIKMLENISGFERESEGARELKKISAPVLAVFAAKPREAEARFHLAKKRELMEALVNAYRKEIPNGDIRLRAAYLNVLFDTQASLLSETEEAELVFIKKSRERLDGLKPMVTASADASLAARVAALDSIFHAYERAFAETSKWKAERTEALAKQEKALPTVAKTIYGTEDSGVEEARRTYLYICFLSLLVVVVSFISLYLGYRVIRVRADIKMEAFLAYLRGFGSERHDATDVNLKALREDGDWSPAVAEAKRAEENFLRSCHTLLAIPRSLKSPCMVVGKEKSLRYWNESAAALFGLAAGKEFGTQDFLTAERLRPRDGEAEPLLEMIRSAVTSLDEDRFELTVKRGEEWAPFELIMSPVTSGPLVGGKVFFWREISSEAERVNKSVNVQLTRARDLVHKVTHQFSVELTPASGDVPAVRAMIDDLFTFKLKSDEREMLWKSEAAALIDQVTRQEEILRRLAEEISHLRASHNEATELVRSVHGGDEHWHNEVCVAEHDLGRWANNRRRLLSDLQEQGTVLGKAKQFEEQLRLATAAVRKEFESFSAELDELRQFAEAARVHSVNISLVKDPGYWEYASRARAFAHELSRFTEKASALGTKVSDFLSAHPGGALAAHLNAPPFDSTLIDEIREEQELVAGLLRRWKESGSLLLSGSERAIHLLEQAEKKGAAASQLGETSLLINEQARGNLERWN